MDYPDTLSLAATIDRVSEALFYGLDIDEGEKQAISKYLTDRHYAPGAYANMFAPTELDMKHDLILFTGEKIKSNAGRRHVMGEEASRILRKLDITTDSVKTVLREADRGIMHRLKSAGGPDGCYCCKTCSCSLWLNISAGGLSHNAQILTAGLQFLKQHREDNGKWKGFPYYYTLYVLNEIGPELALEEMQFAAKTVERWIRRNPQSENKIISRRHAIGERILAQV